MPVSDVDIAAMGNCKKVGKLDGYIRGDRGLLFEWRREKFLDK